MTIRLELYIKGFSVAEECREIADWDNRQVFEMNVRIRDYQVQLWVREMEMKFQKYIQKAEGKAQIGVFFLSKGNDFEISDEELNELPEPKITW